MNIEMKRNAEVTTIEITGRLDTTTAPVLDKMINEDIEGTKDLILDMKGLEYISSAGLRVLLSAQKKMMKIGSMKVVNVCESVMEVLEMTGFTDRMGLLPLLSGETANFTDGEGIWSMLSGKMSDFTDRCKTTGILR